VCVATGDIGVLIGSIGRLPSVGSGACVEVEGWPTTMWAGLTPLSRVLPQ
jgi:hypothetical protein